MTLARGWDGNTYDRISAPMETLGRAVLDRLPLEGSETVLDAGCGSGRVTAALLERLPEGLVIGVDGDASMIESARERLGGDPRVELIVGDLCKLDLGSTRADAILSTATFHWIPDHALLFRRMRRCLVDGGRLVAQCGAEGNIANVHSAAAEVGARDPYRSHIDGWVGPWNFVSPADTERALVEAGFSEAKCWTADAPVEPADAFEHLRTIVLGAHLEQLPTDMRDAFVRDVIAELPTPVVLDYVRLNIDAVA